jgi:flagellin
MALMINTNVQSISAQNSIARAQNEQNTAMERLTTGKRINTAADDAAGLAIANKMTSQVKGLNQAVRNANDGISMLQTAAGGLEETNNILQRMRELAVQSASGTYDQGNRDSMQAEVTQLQAELERIADTTTFNGQKILDGSQSNTSLQVGSNSNETIDFSIGSTAASDLGSGRGADIIGDETTGLAGIQGLAGDITINGQTIDNTAFNATSASTMEKALDILSVAGVEATSFVETFATSTTNGTGALAAGQTINFALTENDGSVTTYNVANTNNLTEFVDAINKNSDGRLNASINDDGSFRISADNAANLAITATGATLATVTGLSAAEATANARISLELTDENDADGINIAYATAADARVLGIDARAGNGAVTGTTAGSIAAGFNAGDITINGVELGAVAGGTNSTAMAANIVSSINALSVETGVTATVAAAVISLTSADGKEITIEYDGAATQAITGLQSNGDAESQTKTVSNIDVSSAAGAQKAIGILDDAISEVSKIQGELGAVNNRLDFTVSNLSNVSENAESARSRIQDADFAAESANLSRAQVLQQAGQAMLAQANSAPQQVLSLLQ